MGSGRADRRKEKFPRPPPQGAHGPRRHGTFRMALGKEDRSGTQCTVRGPAPHPNGVDTQSSFLLDRGKSRLREDGTGRRVRPRGRTGTGSDMARLSCRGWGFWVSVVVPEEGWTSGALDEDQTLSHDTPTP